MSRIRASFPRIVLLGALAAALGLAACGRKGPLDLPPSAAAAPQAAAPDAGLNPMAATPATPDVFDSDGRPIAAQGQKKSLPLDWLID